MSIVFKSFIIHRTVDLTKKWTDRVKLAVLPLQTHISISMSIATLALFDNNSIIIKSCQIYY